MILTTPDYYSASGLVPVLVAAVLLYRLYIFAPGLSIAKQTGMIAVINISAATLNTALNFMLIPHFGLQGAALATLLSAAASFGTHMTLSQRLFFVPHAWRSLGLATLLAVGIVWLGAQFNLMLWADLILKFTLLGFAMAGFIIVGLVKTEELARMRFWLHQLQVANKA